MAIEFTTSSKESKESGVKMTVYGGSGIGKTMLVATMPRPILLSAENGVRSLTKRNIESVWGADRQNITYDIPIIKISSYKDLDAAYNWLVANPQHYMSVAIDSVTELADKCLTDARLTIKDGRAVYGDVYDKIADIFRKLRDLQGKHVLMIGQMGLSKDPITGIERANIIMTHGKLTDKVPYFMDETFAYILHRHTDGKEYRVLKTKIDFQYYAKDRAGCLDALEAPHIGNIIHKIQEYGVA